MNFRSVILSSIIFFTFMQSYAHEHHSQNEPAIHPIQGASIYNLKSEWTTQDERTIRLTIFRKRPVVLAMIYTFCKDACPLIILDMRKIEKGLSIDELKEIQFVLVSFDPENDSPKQLKNYAKAHDLDLKKWTLLHGLTADVRELSAILDVKFKKTEAADFEHSNVITILDSEGVVKHQQVGLNQDPKESLDTLHRILKK